MGKAMPVLTWVAFIEYTSGWYSSSNRSWNFSFTLIPKLYNSSSPSLTSSPPLVLPFQRDSHSFIQDGIFFRESLSGLCFASFIRAFSRTSSLSSSLIRFLVGARVPCLAWKTKLQNYFIRIPPKFPTINTPVYLGVDLKHWTFLHYKLGKCKIQKTA
jgi:hypothetical protein